MEFAKVVSEKARGMFKKKEKYDDYIRNKLHKLKVKINNIIKSNIEGKVDEIYGLDTKW